ncbi:MAG: hypothetical protein ACR2QE_11880 [Acidimicrobiales bacterium]
MSVQGDGLGQEFDEGGFNFRIVIFGILAVILVVFIFQNTSSTEVKFLGFDSEPPLWVSLGLAAVLGALVGQLGAWIYRRSRRNRAET